MSRPRAAHVLAVVLANLLLLALIESALRVLWTVRADHQTAPPARVAEPGWFDYSATLGWVLKPGFRGDAAGPRAFDRAGYLTIDSPQVADT